MFKQNILLAKHSNYRIGGPARYFFESADLEKITAAAQKAKKEKLPIFILGGGTNILFDDSGFSGLIIKPAFDFIKKDGLLVTAGAGASMEKLLEFTIAKKLSGLEWAGGLPGLVGGAVRGNAGAFGGEIKDRLVEVVSLDIFQSPPKIIRRDNKHCQFGYRDSIFKKNDGQEIILEAVFQLSPGDKKEIKKQIEDKIRWREQRQPLDYPNIGSIFKNVDWQLVPPAIQKNPEFAEHIKKDPFPVLPTARLIHLAGLKGVACGGAMISPKHPNFIVNVLQASSEDVKRLIQLVKETIFQKYAITLEEEIESRL